MSDILIRGMEMPENGSCIQIIIDDDGNVYPTVEQCIMKIDSIAKAVPVPPHGKCIDADAIRADIDEKRPGRSYEDAWALTVMDAAPTIIEAEEVQT